MLLSSPRALEKYDVPEPVLDVLRRSAVKHVSIIGRRGPLEAAFTVKELRELTNLPEASMIPIDSSILTVPPNVQTTRQQTRTLDLLRKGSVSQPGTTRKTWSLDFFRSPTGLAPPTPNSTSNLSNLSLSHTFVDPKTNRAVPTGEISILPTSLVVTSLGFYSDPVTPYYDPVLGHLRSVSGRIISSAGGAHTVKHVYASGWAATGAKGVLASTMMDAYAVADTIISDLMLKGQEAGASPVSPFPFSTGVVMNPMPSPDNLPQEVEDGLRKGIVTEYGDWKYIDAEEMRMGMGMGKERERMGWDEAKAYLDGRRSN